MSYSSYRRSYSPSRKGRSMSPPFKKELNEGDRVIVRSSVGDAKTGILRYLGKVSFAEGSWAGVELFYPQGRNDGTVLGVEYFRCKHPYGIFVPESKVDISPVNGVEIKGSGGCDSNCNNCEIHDNVYWNTVAVIGNKVTGIRNPAL